MHSSTLYHQFLILKGSATLSYSDSQTQTYPHQNAMSFLACCFAVLLFYRAGATEARLAWLRIRHASGIQAEAARFCHHFKILRLKKHIHWKVHLVQHATFPATACAQRLPCMGMEWGFARKAPASDLDDLLTPALRLATSEALPWMLGAYVPTLARFQGWQGSRKSYPPAKYNCPRSLTMMLVSMLGPFVATLPEHSHQFGLLQISPMSIQTPRLHKP